MTKLPIVKPNELAKALTKMGFKSRPGKGSHLIFYKDDGRYTSVSMHPRPLGKGLLHKILKQLDISRQQLEKSL